MSPPLSAPGDLPARPARYLVRTRITLWLDWIAVSALLLALSGVLFGGIRFVVGSVRLSAMRPSTLLGFAVAAALIRRGISRHPTLTVRTAQAGAVIKNAVRRVETKAITGIWVATRLGVLLIAFIAVATIGVPPEARGTPITGNPFLNLPYRWDTGWYLAVAVDGYRWDPIAGSTQQQSIAFFPAYPLLMRAGGAVLGARAASGTRTRATLERTRTRTLLAGWLLALGASYAALHALFTWASAVTDRRTALQAVALLSAYPFAIYFSAAYTEALFLLCTLGAFNSLRTGRTVTAAAWGLVDGLVRPNGFLVTLPLMFLAARSPTPRWRLWVAAAMPAVGMLIYSAYIWSLTGRPFAWMEAHAAWGRTAPTWDASVTRPLEQMSSEGMIGYAMAAPYQLLNGAALLFSLSLLPIVWRRLGAPSALLVIVMVGPPLVAGGLMSMGRMTSTLFPVFVVLAQVIPRRHLTAWLVACALAQGLAATLFFTWRPLV